MAEFKLGRIRFVWKNTWTTGTTYYKDDVVKNGGKVYICKLGHTAPADFTTNLSTYWDLLSDGQAWRNTWATSTSYNLNDMVKYGGRLYICSTAHSSAATAALGLEADSGKWQLVAEGTDWKGNWSIDTRYKVRDLVRYGGLTYVCNTYHTSAATISLGLESDSSKWDVFNEGFEFKDTWTSSERYKLNDVVKYGANLWICQTYHTSTGSFENDQGNWSVFVEGLEYESTWNSGTIYQPGDIVSYGGNQYVAKTTHSNKVPPDEATDWDLFSKGFSFQSDWSSGATYKVGEVVRLNGYTYLCTTGHSNQEPPNTSYWQLLNSGTKWRGEWANSTSYKLGDIVRFGTNTFICVLAHTSADDDSTTLTDTTKSPATDLSATYWNIFTTGSEYSVMTVTGDMVYYSDVGPTRLPIGKEGQVLKVSASGIPEWDYIGVVNFQYYVAPHGVDSPAPTYGRTPDKPWKTIRYATEQVEKGPMYPNVQLLLELNRAFIQREVTAWIDRQISTATVGGTWYQFDYDEYKCQRDTGFIIDRVIWDLGHGGNLKTLSAALTYLNALDGADLFATADDENGTGTYSKLSTEGAKDVLAYNYMLSLIEKVINNEAPTTVYQVLNGDNSSSVVTQYTNDALEAEEGAMTRINELVGIVTNALTNQDVAELPSRYVPSNVISIAAGVYTETLPIIVPAETCLLGVEVRGTHVQPSSNLIDIGDAYYSVKTFDKLESVLSDIIVGTDITPTVGNSLTQSSDWPYASSVEQADVTRLVRTMKHKIDFELGTLHANADQPDPTGYNTSFLSGYGDARTLIQGNKDFLKAEVAAYIDTSYTNIFYSRTACKRDIGYIVDAICYDLTYGGSTQTLNAALAYYDGPGSTLMIDSTEKTATLSAYTYLKSLMQTIIANTTVSPLYQTSVAQFKNLSLTGGSSASSFIGSNIDIIYNIINGGATTSRPSLTITSISGTDTLNTTAAHGLAAGDLIIPRTTAYGLTADVRYYVIASGLTSTAFKVSTSYAGSATGSLTNGSGLTYVVDYEDRPTVTNAVTTTTALITAYTTLSAAVGTIVTNMTSYITTNYPTLSYNTTKCQRDARIILDAVGYDLMFNSKFQTIKAAYAYLRSSASDVFDNNQKAATRAAFTYVKTQAKSNVGGDSTAQARIEALMTALDDIIFGATTEGSKCQTELRSADWAVLQLERNRDFIVAEISAYIAATWPSYSYNTTQCERDVHRMLDAIKFDIKYPGNYKSLLSARYYYNAVLSSEEEDMFYVRNGTGIRNMTLEGLNGDLTPRDASGTSRVTAGAYVSLDPGWGPDDFRTWVTSRSCYIQNCCTFGYAATGQKIDGALHNGGNKSMVSNDFTQLISDGIGAWVTNNGRAELVSVFTYYSHIGYLAENGGKIRGTNGNNSYGDWGSVAVGYDNSETSGGAEVDNKYQFKATVGSVTTDGDIIYNFEYDHAGAEYTEATWLTVGPGNFASTEQDEFRDNGVNQVRLLDLVDDSTGAPPSDGELGGFGYKNSTGTAQAGTLTGITLSNTDDEQSSAYTGMIIRITAGNGIGNYAVVSSFDSGTKSMSVVKASDGTPGWDHEVAGTTIVAPDSSSTYDISPRVTFTAPTYSASARTIASGTWTAVGYGNTAAVYTALTGTYSGTGASGATWQVDRVGSKYYLTKLTSGTGYTRLETITIAGTSLGGLSTTNDLTITITSVNSITGAIQAYDFVGVGLGGRFVAVQSGSRNTATSEDATTWTTRSSAMPSAANWSDVAFGNFDDGSSTENVTRFVAVAGTSANTTGAYSADGITWSSSNMVTNATWVGVAFGNSRFVAISSDSTTVRISYDGEVWDTTGTLPTTGFTSITYGKGLFVAVKSGSTTAASSPDGVVWTSRTLPSSSGWSSVAYGNNRFVAISGSASSTVAAYSLNGTTWTATTLPASATWTKIAYGQGMFFAVSSSTQAASSPDGVTWTSRTTGAAASGFSGITFGNPQRSGVFALLGAGTGTVAGSVLCGATTIARAYVSSDRIAAIRIIEPGSGYSSAPTITITDPNNTYEAPTTVYIDKGVLACPSFKNRGTGYITASAELDTGNGYAETFQYGSYVAVRRITARPVPGSNVVFENLPGTYKLVSIVTFRGSYDGSYTAFYQVSPVITSLQAPTHGDSITTRIRYSQVRLTGHDFLNIGFGNFNDSNYPNDPLTGYTLTQANEAMEYNGGRVFFTSTDQDGNFRVGDLFTVEQSTGVATLNADAFNISGLQELSLGDLTLSGGSATITEFSTDPFFTQDSDSVVPTQRAIKAYIASQIGGGGASLIVNSITAGDVFISTNVISNVTGGAIQMNANFEFRSGVTGYPLAFNYFLT